MDVDPLLVVYQGIAARIIAIATAVAPEDLDSPVPACSGWTARQVVAHLAGLCEDWDAGHLEMPWHTRLIFGPCLPLDPDRLTRQSLPA